MHPVSWFFFGLIAGLVIGTAYGRAVEQKAVATALAKFARVDADARQALAYLKGLPHAAETRISAIFKKL